MAEKTEKKNQKNTNEIKISKRFIVGILVVIALAVAVFFVMNGQSNSQTDAAAVVNGEIITITELNKAFDSLPQQYIGTVSKQNLLDQIIQTKVFYQEAKKQGLVVSDEEAIQQFQIAKLSSGLTDEQFSANLVTQGTTEEELIDNYAKQLTVQRFINENLLNKIQISDEEIQKFYDENPEQFKVGEQTTVKHILIGDPNMTKEEQDKKAKELLKEINEDNFCEYVSEYSTDTASVSSCGEYTFSKGDALVEEFKQLSFEQKAGDIGTVQTQFGTHIIWTVEKMPAKTLSLEESKEQIKEYLKTQKGQEQYESFYQEISKDSDIEIVFEEVDE